MWPAVDGKLGDYIRTALINANLYATRTVWDLGFREITTFSEADPQGGRCSGIENPRARRGRIHRPVQGARRSADQHPFNEVYSALQTKIVDAQENPLGLIVTSKIYEVQKYCSLSNHIWQGNWVLFNGRDLEEPAGEAAGDRRKSAQRGRARATQGLVDLDQSFRDTMTKGGIQFNDVDAASFRAKLKTAGYYADVRRNLVIRHSSFSKRPPAARLNSCGSS